MSSQITETDLLELFRTWRHEGLTPLVTVRGYADLLLKGQVGELTDQQRQFIQIIRNATSKAALAWHSPGYYLKLQAGFDETRWKWEAVQLSQVISDSLSNPYRYIDESNVRVYLPDRLPSVKASRDWLGVAITNLLEPAPGYAYIQNYPNAITADQTDEFTISVQIRCGLILDPEHKDVASISYPGNSINVADLVLKKHGSPLTIHPMRRENEPQSQGTEFRFSLPIWDED